MIYNRKASSIGGAKIARRINKTTKNGTLNTHYDHFLITTATAIMRIAIVVVVKDKRARVVSRRSNGHRKKGLEEEAY